MLGLGSTRIRFGHFLYEPVSVSYQQLKKEDMFHNKNHEACSASACLKSLARLTFWVTGSVDTRPKRSETKVAISILMATFVYWQTNMFLWACVLLRFLFGEVSKVWELFEFGASTFGQCPSFKMQMSRLCANVFLFTWRFLTHWHVFFNIPIGVRAKIRTATVPPTTKPWAFLGQGYMKAHLNKTVSKISLLVLSVGLINL